MFWALVELYKFIAIVENYLYCMHIYMWPVISLFDICSFSFLSGFLNVDDDEAVEEDDESMPCGEETRLLENSGWSSRTRCICVLCFVLCLNAGGNSLSLFGRYYRLLLLKETKKIL